MVGGITGAAALRATDRSCMTITPVGTREQPETREQRIVTAPVGTNNAPFRFVSVESAMLLTHPALLVPVVIKWVSETRSSAALKNCAVRRISCWGPGSTLYISNHWIFNAWPLVALPTRLTSEYHSP